MPSTRRGESFRRFRVRSLSLAGVLTLSLTSLSYQGGRHGVGSKSLVLTPSKLSKLAVPGHGRELVEQYNLTDSLSKGICMWKIRSVCTVSGSRELHFFGRPAKSNPGRYEICNEYSASWPRGFVHDGPQGTPKYASSRQADQQSHTFTANRHFRIRTPHKLLNETALFIGLTNNSNLYHIFLMLISLEALVDSFHDGQTFALIFDKTRSVKRVTSPALPHSKFNILFPRCVKMKYTIGHHANSLCFNDGIVGLPWMLATPHKGNTMVFKEDVLKWRSKVMHRLGIEFPLVSDQSVTVIARQRRNLVNLDFFLRRIRAQATYIDRALADNVTAQILLASRSRVWIAPHGQANALSLFLPPNAILIELFPDYQLEKYGYLGGTNTNSNRIYGSFSLLVGVKHVLIKCTPDSPPSAQTKDFRSFNFSISDEDIENVRRMIS